MSTRRNVRYSPLAGEESDDDNGIGGQEDLRFTYNPRAFDRVPWTSIALALFLLALGSILLFLAFIIFAGHMEGDKSQAFRLLALGVLSFLPGFYETRVAYYAWRGVPGTAGIWQIIAIKEASGWNERTIVEDMDLAVRASLKGSMLVTLRL